MRVIAGKWSGRTLAGAEHLRPTQDRVKESLFSILGGAIEGLFVDLFAGVGSVGIEAASRGARAVLVDRDERSIEGARRNLELLDSPESIQLLHQDALAFAKRPPETLPQPADYIFLDPPYAYPALEKLLRAMAKSPLVGPETLVILEHEISLTPGRRAPGLELTRRDDYGDTSLSTYRRVECP